MIALMIASALALALLLAGRGEYPPTSITKDD